MRNNKVWERKYIFLQPDDDRRFRDFAGRTGHGPKWDAVGVGECDLVRHVSVGVTGV